MWINLRIMTENENRERTVKLCQIQNSLSLYAHFRPDSVYHVLNICLDQDLDEREKLNSNTMVTKTVCFRAA